MNRGRLLGLGVVSGLTTLDLKGTQGCDLSPLAGLKRIGVNYLGKYQAARIANSLGEVVKRN